MPQFPNDGGADDAELILTDGEDRRIADGTKLVMVMGEPMKIVKTFQASDDPIVQASLAFTAACNRHNKAQAAVAKARQDVTDASAEEERAHEARGIAKSKLTKLLEEAK